MENKARLHLMRNLNKTMLKKVTRDTCSKSVFIVPAGYASYTVICHSYPKEWRLANVKNLCVMFMTIKTLSYT